jgi:hypothetical protein
MIYELPTLMNNRSTVRRVETKQLTSASSLNSSYRHYVCTCEVFRCLLAMAPLTAWSKSADLNTIKALTPPSSSETFFTVSTHFDISNCKNK